MSYTIPLDRLQKDELASAGGKGAHLGELTRAGLPVPPGFVLTTAAYNAFVKEHSLQDKITILAARGDEGDPQSLAEATAAIKELFLTAEMPEDIQSELVTAYQDLTRDTNTAVAVRSSATAEDLLEASFAGQQDTYLNVKGEKALLRAVKGCWASLWSARAMAYRRHQRIEPDDLSLAIIVQALIPADSAGILFTANPTSGERRQIVINAAWGLGEAVVGGQVTPDTAIVDKTNLQILSRETALKTTMTVLTTDGTANQPVPRSQQTQPALDDPKIVELARMGAQIETLYDMPMDIEWAICDGSIAILQARPITNLPPAPLQDVRWEPPKPGTIWMRRQVVEHMPEPLSPLFDELYLREGLFRSMETLGEFLSELSGVDIEMRAFLDPPFAATVNGYAYSTASFKFSPAMIPTVLQMYIQVLPKMIQHLVPRWRDESLPHYLAVSAHWKDIDLSAISDEALLQGVRELTLEDAIYWFAAAVPLGLARTADAAFNSFLKSVSAGKLTSGAFLRGFPSKAMEAQAQLEATARKIRVSDALLELVINTPASRLLAALEGYPEGKDILEDLQQYLDAYGHQIYNLDFAAPTLADDPLPVLLSLKTAVQHPEQDAHDSQTALAQERDALAARTERSLNRIQRPVFKKLLSWAQTYSPYREEAIFYVGAGWPALRRLAFELGQRLTDAGSLYNPGDVFYLESAELESASADRAKGIGRSDLGRLAQERRALRQARMRLNPPAIVPPDGRMKFGPIDMGMFEPKPRTVSTGPTLDGFAVSPGKVTAPASVIRSPEDFDKMKPDSILVCTTTTPAWTPLFARAKGLVTDIGGALAHGSIVAREYAIPAVMGTGNATQRIKDGERIRVDGDSGTVTLVDQVDPQEAVQALAQRAAAQQTAARRRKAILLLAAGVVGLLFFLLKKRRRSSAPD